MKGLSMCAMLVALAAAAPVTNARQADRKGRAWDFSADEPDKAPAGWSFRQTNPSKAMATWRVVEDRTAPSSPHAVAITKAKCDDGTFNLALVDGSSFTDIDLTVQVKPISGSVDQGGGAVWRCRDENNYYISRLNPLESNFRVYYVKNGRRKQLQSAHINTKAGTWYSLRVTMIGNHITGYLDGKKLLETTDETFKDAGMVGLWAKADALTQFDDLQVFPPQRQAASLLTMRQTIALPGVQGRLDHLTLDAKGNRLFLAAPENGTVEVVDLTSGERIHSIDGLSQPQGILYLPKSKRVIVACGGDGSVRSFDTSTFKEVARSDLGGNADNIRWDASSNLLYVGFGDGALGVLDADRLTKKREIKLAGHPESFQLDRSNGRIYVNVPAAGRITVIDRKTHSVVAHWKTAGAAENFPMMLDEAGKTLLVACRKPPRLLAFDTALGARLASVACVGDADDLFYDRKRNRIYAIGGEGFVDIFAASAGSRRSSRSAYPRTARIRTSPGARTALFVPKRGLLYVAAPAREEQEARVLIYQALP